MELADGTLTNRRETKMTLKKAVEIAEIEEASDFQGITYDYEDAIRLLIEAGKVLQHGRLIGAHHDPALLPGETE